MAPAARRVCLPDPPAAGLLSRRFAGFNEEDLPRGRRSSSLKKRRWLRPPPGQAMTYFSFSSASS